MMAKEIAGNNNVYNTLFHHLDQYTTWGEHKIKTFLNIVSDGLSGVIDQDWSLVSVNANQPKLANGCWFWIIRMSNRKNNAMFLCNQV